MNLAVSAFKNGTPGVIKNTQLRILLKATSRAFGCQTPKTNGLAYQELLDCFTNFTYEQACCALSLPPAESARVNKQLYTECYQLGARLRRSLHLRKGEDIQALIIILYQNIGITLKGAIPGDITVTRCHFSTRYTPEVCGFISALDAGIMAGLFGRGSLDFSERITEGTPCCKAHFSQGKEVS